ncbi:hypothetical protein EGW69_11935 [Enterococcus faecium]|uniref:hypothetical protein n=1 Tax=Enterococcus TaxID=1350 RepID=UPI00070C3256|nr:MULTISPECIES: hypothetical protein [Enterococcus]KXF71701.1 hypothetical protein AQ486_03720 [Enterococcus faecalis]KXF73009.1 hypothetical protein AQ487_09500 [Enterococcus faecalis]MBC2813714.1 hypothetical protein [Enterococcus faecalis]MBC2817339.1 hypothetical protein [Enterococcus faecalis]MBC2821547.1 hypothetical protein [Enterococcus faecalis]
MKIRNNKNYITIYLEKIDINEFKESIEKYSEVKKTERYVVIKPTKKAINEFIHLHSLPLSKCKKGDNYRILGILFTVSYIENGFVTFSYFNREGKKKEFTPFVQNTAPVAGVLLETIYEHITGKLLYF